MLAVSTVAMTTSAEIKWWDEGTMEEVASWSDPSGNGSDLQVEYSPDGSKLLIAGFGSPNEIRVVDRNVGHLATLDMKGIDVQVKGTRWSHQGTWIVAWGREEGGSRDLLMAWSASTFEPSQALFDDDLPPLEVVDSVVFPSNDGILAIAGRDALGTSRLLIMETHSRDVLNNITWEGNATLLTLETDNQNLVCIDETGALTSISTRNWDIQATYEGVRSRPSCWSFPRHGGHPWLAGYEDGTVYFWMNTPREPGGKADLGEGPLLGVAWLMNDQENYYVVALPGADGGSDVQAYIYHEEGRPAVAVSDTVTVDGRITMLVMDPVDPWHAIAGLEDGTLVALELALLPDTPPEITVDEPAEGTKHSENFTARGKVIDERDNVSYVRVWVDELPFAEAVMSDDEWSTEVDVRMLKAGSHVLHVEAFDGTYVNTTQVTFRVEWEKEGESSTPGPSGPLALIAALLTAMIFLHNGRARR